MNINNDGKQTPAPFYEFTLTAKFSAEPAVVFSAWLSSEGHTAMTGGIAHMSAEEGADYDAWDGYISGRNIEIEKYSRIVQSWRTSHFAESDPDSIIELSFAPVSAGTLLTLRHKNVPADQSNYEQQGWNDYYFEPMKRRFTWLQMNPAA